MRKFLACLIVLAFTFAQVRESEGIEVSLTEKEVQEAINWEAGNKDSLKNIFDNINSPYLFGEIAGPSAYGYIHTKFSSLVFLSQDSARRYESLKKSDIEEILNAKTLSIAIIDYGEGLDFAKNYLMVLKQGEKIIHPAHVDRRTETSIFSTISKIIGTYEGPPFKTTVSADFPYSEFDPNAKTTIILIRDRGRKESRFEVDFSRYK